MNVLVIMSDEHSYQAMGCSGHPIVRTPNLDRLAREGTSFTQCYTNSPVCTPARGSFFTGQYVHQLGNWDNATPYDGKQKGISHHLHEHGLSMTAFGKLDFHPQGEYPGLTADPSAHRTQVDVGAFFRSSNQPRPHVENRYRQIKVRDGRCYDDRVRDDAISWLKGKTKADEPWVLYVGFLHPHFPFLVKKEHWDYYDALVTEIPETARAPFTSLNEPLRALRTHFNGDQVDEETIRRFHVGYYSLIAEMDDNVGQILQTLDEQGLADDTLIVYTSDHGEQMGNHGLWFKCCMFEESSRIPLIVKGPGVKAGQSCGSLVSLVDLYPTIAEALDLPAPERVRGRSLLDLTQGKEEEPDRDFVFSEYHAHGMPSGMFMIRWKKYKYVYFTDFKPQLFDLENDPQERNDLNRHDTVGREVQEVLDACYRRLRSVCSPEEVDRRAKDFQERTRRSLGIASYTQADPAGALAARGRSDELPDGLPVPFPEYGGDGR